MPAHLNWDQYFILIALFTSLRSKDPNSKVGAVIVDQENHIVGTGYNGFVGGIDESLFSWSNNTEQWLESKYPFVVHAEKNAILNATTSALRGCRIYTTLFPCNDCALVIAQKNIQEVIYVSDKHRGSDTRLAAERIFDAANITTRKIDIPKFEELVRDTVTKIMEYEEPPQT